MQSMKTHRDVIDRWPAHAAFAEDVGMPVATAESMYYRNSIGKHWFKAVVNAAKQKGFLNITMSFLEESKSKRTKVKKPVGVEHAIQKELFDVYSIKAIPGSLLFAIPNGGKRNKITGKKLKDEGVTPGVPDIWGRSPGRMSFWIEQKREKGRISKDQLDIHNKLKACGERVYVSYSLKQSLNILKSEGIIYD